MGLETVILYGRFPELMRELRGANPQFHIDVVEMWPEAQLLALKEGRIDVGMSRTRIADPPIRTSRRPIYAKSRSSRLSQQTIRWRMVHRRPFRWNRPSSCIQRERLPATRARFTPYSRGILFH
jgi:DNA-binding transcriptional LysR family regulator